MRKRGCAILKQKHNLFQVNNRHHNFTTAVGKKVGTFSGSPHFCATERENMSFHNLTSPALICDLVKPWLLEDIPNFDVGGYVVGE
jgi:hypothetical protein